MTLRADGEEDPENPVGDGKVRPPTKRLRWKWDDGKYHDSPPPSSEVMVIETTYVPPGSGMAEAVKVARPMVPADFAHTPRTLLRQTAFDFVLRAAALNMRGHSTITGAELIAEAEELEKWLANP